MSKKIISLLLTLMLTVSMVAVAAVSVSAEVDEQGRYTPSDGTPTNKYYFYMPSDWYNDCAFNAGIYWWLGSDAPAAWPGYNAHNADAENVYYCDVPVDATTIIWNNGYDGGEDSSDPNYAKAIQTVDIASQLYSNGDSDIYDSDFFAEMEESYNGDKAALGAYADNFFYDTEYDLGFVFDFDNMIYVINPDMVSVNALNGKITSGGEWYFYYGNGEYGTYPTREAAVEKGVLFTSDYQPAKDVPATTEPDSEPATDATDATVVTDASEATEPATSSVPYLTVNATSNYFPKATAEYNEETNEVTVTYWMKSSKKVLDLQWILHYDSNVLSVSKKNTDVTICPTIGDRGVLNLSLNDAIKYNATNLKLFDFTSAETPFAKVVFDVKDLSATAPVSTTVDLEVEVLRVSKIDPETFSSDPKEEVMLCNFSEVLDDEFTKTVQVDRRTELTPSTYVEPTTAESTAAPTTTEETTEPVTTVPDTTAEPEPTVPNLTVNATSNYFPKATAEYDKSTNEVVVTYWMQSAKNVLDLQWYVTYDSEILTLSDKNTYESVCPVIGESAVMNTGIKNKIKYNATNLRLFDFSSAETPFAQIVFDVNDLTGKAPATTTIDLTVEVLRVSEINEETFRTDPAKEIILVDNSQVIDNEQTASANVRTRTTLTPSTFVAPTTAEPTTVEPTTTEPIETTVEPTTTEFVEPTTTAPVEPTTTESVEPTTTVPVDPTTEPVEPTTTVPVEPATTVSTEPTTVQTHTEIETLLPPATDSTSETGTTVSKATGDTPTSPGNNNAVQTGDASLAVIILSILVGATCVMFVLRKREMF